MIKILFFSLMFIVTAHASTPDAKFVEKMDFNKLVDVKEKEISTHKFDSDRTIGKEINRSPSIEIDHRKRRASKQ